MNIFHVTNSPFTSVTCMVCLLVSQTALISSKFGVISQYTEQGFVCFSNIPIWICRQFSESAAAAAAAAGTRRPGRSCRRAAAAPVGDGVFNSELPKPLLRFGAAAQRRQRLDGPGGGGGPVPAAPSPPGLSRYGHGVPPGRPGGRAAKQTSLEVEAARPVAGPGPAPPALGRRDGQPGLTGTDGASEGLGTDYRHRHNAGWQP